MITLLTFFFHSTGPCISQQLSLLVLDLWWYRSYTSWLVVFNDLDVLFNRIARFVLNYSFGTHSGEMLSTLNGLALSQRKKLHLLKMTKVAMDRLAGECFGAPCWADCILSDLIHILPAGCTHPDICQSPHKKALSKEQVQYAGEWLNGALQPLVFGHSTCELLRSFP